MLAWAPLLVVCLLALLRCNGPVTALAGLLAAIAGCVLGFPVTVGELQETIATLAFTFAELLAVIAGGMLLAAAMTRSGAQQRIAAWLLAAAGTRERATLLVCLVVAPFFESCIGFGVGLVVVLPLLLALGHDRLRSVLLGLFGLALAPWGVMGQGIVVAAELAGLQLTSVGVLTAWLTLPMMIVLGVAVLLLGIPRGRRGGSVPVLVLILLVQAVVLLAVNAWFSVPLAAVLACCAAVAACLLTAGGGRAGSPGARRILMDATAYFFLLGGLLCSRLLVQLLHGEGAPLELWLRIAESPATWLLLASGVALLPAADASRWSAAAAAARGWLLPGTTVALYLGLGIVLQVSGMSAQIAATTASAGEWGMVAMPATAALAGMATGSTSAVSAMFSAGTVVSAPLLGIDPEHGVALQTVAAAAGTVVNPAKLALAGSILGGGLDQRRAYLLVMAAVGGALVVVVFVSVCVAAR